MDNMPAQHQPSEWQIHFKKFLRAVTQNAAIVYAVSIFETRGVTERRQVVRSKLLHNVEVSKEPLLLM